MPIELIGRPLPQTRQQPANYPLQNRSGKFIDPEILGGYLVGNTITDLTEDSEVARGYTGHATITSAVTGITTEQDVTGLSVAYTSEADRWYKITAALRLGTGGTAASVSAWITDATPTKYTGGVVYNIANVENHLTLTMVRQTGAGSVTLKVRASATNTSSVNASATAPSWLIVEDIGLGP